MTSGGIKECQQLRSFKSSKPSPFALALWSILQQVTQVIASGAPTIIMGPNGSGKTTLLKLAMGLIEPSDGTVETLPGIRKSFVFQRPIMLRRSVLANVAFARAAAALPAAPTADRQLLEMVGLGDMPERPARKLSGGEQQRLALARAIARDPQLLFLDEPTASLDPKSTKDVEDVIARIAGCGVKIVMSTHDIGQARRLAGEVILLSSGQIVETTPAPQFFINPQTDTARRFLAGELLH